jgi:beta-xylosidase
MEFGKCKKGGDVVTFQQIAFYNWTQIDAIHLAFKDDTEKPWIETLFDGRVFRPLCRGNYRTTYS